MNREEKKRTADVLTEKSKWIMVGLLPIKLKPLTLGQIYEMGEFTTELEAEGIDIKGLIIASAEMLQRYKSAKLLEEVFLVGAYRKRWKRFLFRRYIRHRLTLSVFQRLLDVIRENYTANFFLTSIIFLHQTNLMTEPKQTIPHGQQSEE